MSRGSMKRLAAVLTAALFHAAAPRADEGAQALFRQVAPSVVTILALDERGREEGQGSGVAVGGERVATNCHVVRDARSLKVRSAAGEQAATWIIADPSRDLCLLAVPGLKALPVNIRRHQDVAVGERVFAVGNPLGFELSVSAGLVSLLAPQGGEPAIMSSAALSPGSSGGGLFDTEGRLIGITTRIMGVGQNLNLALPAEWIAELDSRGVPARPPAAAPAPEPSWSDEAEALRARREWAALEILARRWLAAHPSSSRAGYFLGVGLVNLERQDEARQILLAAVRNDERDAGAWSYLAVTLDQAGQKDEAEAALARAAKLRPGSAYISYLRAGWLRAAGRLDEARASIERAIALEPGDSNHWIGLAQIEAAFKRWPEAARALRAALRLNPADPMNVKGALADALARAGKSDQAHELLGSNENAGTSETWLTIGLGDLAVNRYADGERALRKAIALDPKNFSAWFNLGVVLQRTARTQEAEEAYERCLALKPDFAGALFARSGFQHARGDVAGAVVSLRRAAEADPADARVWRRLAAILYAARTFPDAAEAYRKLAELGVADAADLATLGDCLNRTGQVEPAGAALRQAEKLAPNHPRVLLGFAAWWGQKNDYKRSLEYAARATDAEPGDAAAWSTKGYALLRLGRFTEAVATLQTAVALDATMSNSWINLGHALLRNREPGKAIASLNKAVELEPGAVDAHLYLAEAYLVTGQTARAREEAEAVLSRAPDYPPALGILTLSLLIDGRKDDALAGFKRLKAKDPVAARVLRAQVIAGGMPGASALPE